MSESPTDPQERLSRLESTVRKMVLALGILSGLVGGLILLQALDYRRSQAKSTAEATAPAQVVQDQLGFAAKQ